MPIVEVEVDAECDGDCDAAGELRGCIAEAIRHLRAGNVDDAMQELLRQSPDAMAKRQRDKEAELTRLYLGWLECTPPRPDFITWAHKRRKFTLC